MHSITTSVITFSCGVVIGVAGAYIAMMVSQMWRDTHRPRPVGFRAVSVNIDVLAHIRQCLHRWAQRYVGTDHARRHWSETNTLVKKIDEILLEQ